jgi:hypothetical protein
MDSSERYTGIIRTLPYYGAGHSKEANAKRRAYRRMMKAFRKADRGDSCVYVAFAQKPKHEVLHCYILVEGQVRVRANISHWEEGRGTQVESFDGHDLSDAKYWAVLTGPVSFPPEPVKRKGTQGFRYVKEPLW